MILFNRLHHQPFCWLLTTSFGFFIASHAAFLGQVYGDEPLDISNSIQVIPDKNVERNDGGRSESKIKVYRVGGETLEAGKAYVFKLSGARFDLDSVPVVLEKSCGCVSPEIVVDKEGDWSARIRIQVEESHLDDRYVQQINLAPRPTEDKSGGPNSASEVTENGFRIVFDFQVDQPVKFEVDRRVVDFNQGSSTVVITGKWRRDYLIDGTTFRALPNFEVSAEGPTLTNVKIDKSEHSGTWAVKIRPTTNPPPLFCRLSVYDHKGALKASFSLQPSTAGRLAMVSSSITFHPTELGHEASFFLKVKGTAPVREQDLSAIQITGQGVTTVLSLKNKGLIAAKLVLRDSSSVPEKLNLEIKGLGSFIHAEALVLQKQQLPIAETP